MKPNLLFIISLLLISCTNANDELVPVQNTPIVIGGVDGAAVMSTESPIVPAVPEATSTPTATETATPPASMVNSSKLWWADFETGSTAQLYLPDTIGGPNNGGGIFNTASGAVTITDQVAHSGRYSAEMNIDDGQGAPQAVRMFRWSENPKEAYYSVWFMFPRAYRPERWWNVLQFLSQGPEPQSTMWVLNVGNRPDGEMYFYLFDWQERKTYSQDLANIPITRWLHVEILYRRSSDDEGRVAVWQDNQSLFDLQSVRTANSNLVKWSVDNYADRIEPGPATIYADDMAISTDRVDH